jgi:hypothetical protein
MPKEDKKLEIAKEELRIVRKFLRRNKVNEMCAVLQQIGDELHGAEVFSGQFPVPANEKATFVFTNVDWDTDNYFDPANPTRLTVPDGLGGRYFVQVAIRWYNPDQVMPPPPDDIEVKDSFFYTYVSKNGTPHAVGNDARSTVNMVAHGATGTTQHFTFDMSLDGGEFIEVNFWQDFFDPVRNDAFLTLRRLGS